MWTTNSTYDIKFNYIYIKADENKEAETFTFVFTE